MHNCGGALPSSYYFANRDRQLAGSVKKISNARQVCAWSVIVAAILNVAMRLLQDNANQRHEQMLFHKPLQNLNIFSVTNQYLIFYFLAASLDRQSLTGRRPWK